MSLSPLPVLLSALVLVSAGCRPSESPAPTETPEGPNTWALEEAPPELRGEVERAVGAMNALQSALIERLTTALGNDGPAAAVSVCADVAPGMPETIAEVHDGVSLGRTSLRLRNPANAPRPWAKAWLERNWDAPAAEATAMVYDFGDSVGVIRPIGTLGMCETCHGEEAGIPPEVRVILAERYPKDEAVGFSVGDLRGAFWAEVGK